MNYTFADELSRKTHAGVSKSLVLTGSTCDLFFDGSKYVPLTSFLISRWTSSRNWIVIHYSSKGELKFLSAEGGDTAKTKLKEAWLRLYMQREFLELITSKDVSAKKVAEEKFEFYLNQASSNPSLALELMKQLCESSRSSLQTRVGEAERKGPLLLRENIIVLIEGADFIFPRANITQLSPVKEKCIQIAEGWFSDPNFMNSTDAVVLLAESKSLLHEKIAKLPQLLEIKIPFPDGEQRFQFVQHFNSQQPEGKKVQFFEDERTLAELTAGLSIYALQQLLRDAVYDGRKLEEEDVTSRVREFIEQELGTGVVEFKRPKQKFSDIVGNRRLIKFIEENLLSRLKSTGEDAVSGITVCGPIGAGKTFIFEVVASMTGRVVLVLKGFRSMWFGETDLIIERLRRLLCALSRVLIFVDEADAQFGGVGKDTHETERRATAKFHEMMSDPKLRGNVVWLWMTARIHLLSPDILRPGRAGDFIIPVLDPSDDERKEFVKWMLKGILELDEEKTKILVEKTKNYSAATYGAVRAELKARKETIKKFEDVVSLLEDFIPLDQSGVREYQTLQAKMHCTRRSLLPEYELEKFGGDVIRARDAWSERILELEQEGVS